MISAENLSYSTIEQVVNKINYIHIGKICLIYNTNSTLTNTYDQSMQDVLGLLFSIPLFFHIEHKNLNKTKNINPDIFLTLIKIHQLS